MPDTKSPLDLITIQSPCTESWDRMTGDEQRRFCGACRLHVYDLSAMRREDAEALVLSRREGERLCVRFARRPDGRVVTDDCGPVRKALRRRAQRAKAAAAALFAMFFPAWTSACSRGPSGEPERVPTPGVDGPETGNVAPLRLMGEMEPPEMLGRIAAPPAPREPSEMGDVVLPKDAAPPK